MALDSLGYFGVRTRSLDDCEFPGGHLDWYSFFGRLDAEHVDLAKLLVMEFALSLVVTDTFGIRSSLRPSEQTQVNPGESPWSMYKLAGDGVRSDFIFDSGLRDRGCRRDSRDRCVRDPDRTGNDSAGTALTVPTGYFARPL